MDLFKQKYEIFINEKIPEYNEYFIIILEDNIVRYCKNYIFWILEYNKCIKNYKNKKFINKALSILDTHISNFEQSFIDNVHIKIATELIKYNNNILCNYCNTILTNLDNNIIHEKIYYCNKKCLINNKVFLKLSNINIEKIISPIHLNKILIRPIYNKEKIISNLILQEFKKLDISKCCIPISIILNMAFKKKNIKSNIVKGFGLNIDSKLSYFHCWVETENNIYDLGTQLNNLLYPFLNILKIKLSEKNPINYERFDMETIDEIKIEHANNKMIDAYIKSPDTFFNKHILNKFIDCMGYLNATDFINLKNKILSLF